MQWNKEGERRYLPQRSLGQLFRVSYWHDHIHQDAPQGCLTVIIRCYHLKGDCGIQLDEHQTVSWIYMEIRRMKGGIRRREVLVNCSV
ncbi:hypothetical protein E2C01_018084 [Portunus trituberculatus]|uniref:Uncharacterized protein n=1 Tax=Portunus trituberculatus TaxID=210409 RepID=A0A5B7DV91_PORTR|nr:hypothetical protein [Portunus trituberculatus]